MMFWMLRNVAFVGLIWAGWLQTTVGSDDLSAVYTLNQSSQTIDYLSKVFEGKFRFVPTSAAFLSQPRLLRWEKMPVLRNEAGESFSAEVQAACVVDEKGRVIDCAVLKSTDEQASRLALELIRKRRYVPADLKWESVSTVDFDTIRFEASKKRGFFPGQTYQYPLDQDYAKRCPPEKMRAYIERLTEVCRKYFEGADTPEGLGVAVVVLPRQGARIWIMSTRRDPEDPERPDLRRQLEAVPVCDVKGGPVAFAIVAKIADGEGLEFTAIDHGYELPIPKKWARFTGRDRRFSDAYFEKLWYLEDR